MPRPELYPVKKIVGFDDAMIHSIERWRAKQKPIPNASEAIRRLVELGLTATPSRATRERVRDSKVAGQRLNRMAD